MNLKNDKRVIFEEKSRQEENGEKKARKALTALRDCIVAKSSGTLTGRWQALLDLSWPCLVVTSGAWITGFIWCTIFVSFCLSYKTKNTK